MVQSLLTGEGIAGARTGAGKFENGLPAPPGDAGSVIAPSWLIPAAAPAPPPPPPLSEGCPEAPRLKYFVPVGC